MHSFASSACLNDEYENSLCRDGKKPFRCNGYVRRGGDHAVVDWRHVQDFRKKLKAHLPKSCKSYRFLQALQLPLPCIAAALEPSV